MLSSTNPHLKDIYEQTKKNEERLSMLRQNARTDKNRKKIEELQLKNDALQLELMRGCSEYADFTNYISYCWKDVQNRLTDDDVTLEFTVVNIGTFDDECFIVALVLTKDMDSPEMLPICDLKTAKLMEHCASEEDADATVYSNPVAFSQIWQLILPLLQGKNRIYFWADGPLNHLAKEYLSFR